MTRLATKSGEGFRIRNSTTPSEAASAIPIDKFTEIFIERDEKSAFGLCYRQHHVVWASPRAFANPENVMSALAQSGHAIARYVFVRAQFHRR